MKTGDLLKQAKANADESSISSADKSFETAQKANEGFLSLKNKLLSIGEWNAHAFTSSYELFDEDGNVVGNGELAVGLLIRIKIAASGKFDWIRVINFHGAADEFIITVKPAFDPTAENKNKNIISHFFTDESTNNFCLFKKNKTVAFYVIGLNEKQNTTETSGALETIRNLAVNVATYLGTQKSEWEKFCHHFLEDAAKKNTI
ncbi:MAG: hypothetical protein ABIP06_05255 [Pyrinomonadaceae bacterium]